VGKITRETFFRNTRKVLAKKLGKKLSEKRAKKHFLYSHEYRDQKMRGETHETIFPETHELCEKKMFGKISSEKSAKKPFFIFTRIS